MPKKTESASVSVASSKLTRETWRALHASAKADQRSVSSLIRKLVLAHLAQCDTSKTHSN